MLMSTNETLQQKVEGNFPTFRNELMQHMKELKNTQNNLREHYFQMPIYPTKWCETYVYIRRHIKLTK